MSSIKIYPAVNKENPFTDDTFYENRKKISKIRKKITGSGD